MRYFAIIVLMVGLVTGMIFRGSFLHQISIIALAIWILTPCVLALGICAIISHLKRGPSWPARALVAVGIVGASLMISLAVGLGFHNYEIRSVRNFVAQAAPVLDDIKMREGKYPANLPESLLGKRPKLLGNPGSYSSDGESFRFEYWDPAGMMDGYEFCSAKRQWVYFD